ncbi:RHS repeat-associated core domain-containing protein [Mitsuaria sp. GD03876]|uniref:RHS repeat domain-containing protein n=1 Tax=Mitsuaria sp. GD03876 TaxID=2975399 RepID=UPI00244C64F8|nr:RHS repeat-associated core domain-containing protein [Mitsuaria sp. GD03876]MDH0868219.1 hypothetical protein [Mitsuaria sp. GD03876]
MRKQGVRLGVLALTAGLAMAAECAWADTSTSPADPSSYSRTLKFSYEAGTGRLAETTVEPDKPALCKRTSVGYDDWGNVTRSTESHCDDAPLRVRVAAATTQDKYEAVAAQSFKVNGATVTTGILAGFFATKNENALSQTKSTAFDPRFGVPIQVTDPNSAVSKTELDDFGRTVRATAPDGTSVVTFHCVLSSGEGDTAANSDGCPAVTAPERPDAAVFMTHAEPRNAKDKKSGAFVRTYLDALGRPIRVATESFDGAKQPSGRSGAIVVTDTVYGPQGQKLLQTSAYFLSTGSSTLAGSQDVAVSSFDYDDLGRVKRTVATNPKGRTTQSFGGGGFGYGSYGSRAAAEVIVEFSAGWTRTTDPQGRKSLAELDGLRQVVRVTDRGGAQVAYRYDAFGQPVETRDALQNVSSMAYDQLGRVVAVDDPDKGVSQSCLDVLGRPKATQTSNQRGGHVTGDCPDFDASASTAPVKAGWTTYAYDALGRKVEQRSGGDRYTWTYDSGTGAKGRLSQSTTDRGVTKRFYYDGIGRATSSRTDIAQGPSFASSVSYDGDTGRLDTKTYPTGLKVSYDYTALGYLAALRTQSALDLRPMPASAGGTRPNGILLSGNSILWAAQTQRADGRVEQTWLSSNVTATTVTDAIGRVTGQTVQSADLSKLAERGYVWDDVDNLKTRTDNIGSGSGAVSESFEYDTLNRLEAYTVASPAIPNLQRRVELMYTALGMIRWKSDLGGYVYPTQGAGVRLAHAPTTIAGAQLGYDLNGNVVSRSSGKYKTLTYTDFDRVETAQARDGGINYAWAYDESEFRIKESRATWQGTRTLWYLHPDAVGGLGYEMETAGGSTSHRHFLSIGGQAIGVIVSDAALPALNSQQTAPSSVDTLAINKVEYWHQDYQGSLMATTDHAGAVTARYAYDPFGQRRQTDGNFDTWGSLLIDWRADVNAGTSRGFTGHEHRDDVGLINMNGRIYDGRAGLFLQADPLLQDRFNTQNYSAYSYVFNNPLNTVDPSGMQGCAAGGRCPDNVLPPSKNDGKRAPLSEDRYKDDDRWLAPLPDWAPNGEIQRVKDQTQASRLIGLFTNCPTGACMRLVDKGAPASNLQGLEAAQFKAAQYAAKVRRKASALLSDLRRSFGIFDRMKPSRESIREGVEQAFFGHCFTNCAMREAVVDMTSESFEGFVDGLAEAGNEYYPTLAEGAFMALLLPESTLANTAKATVAFETKQAARAALDGPLGAAANRFFRGAAKNAQDFRITDLADAGKRFEFFSPARNAGYGKLYVQEVDSTGAIVREFKDTLGPRGLIETKWVHGGP